MRNSLIVPFAYCNNYATYDGYQGDTFTSKEIMGQEEDAQCKMK